MRCLVRIVSLVALILTMLAGALSNSAAVAHDATPQAGADQFPLTPDPALCTVEPRDTDELLDLWFPEEASPAAAAVAAAVPEEAPTEVTIPVGEPADDATIAGVTSTVHDVFSCFAAGDFPRALAHFSDDLVRTFGPEPGQTREDVAAFLEMTPVPEEGGEEIVLLAITDVMMLGDGRVGAFVVDHEQTTQTVYVIFEQGGDRWLVDEVIEFSSAPEGEDGS